MAKSKNSMKRFGWLMILVAMVAVSCGYRYESVEGDKSATRIYTLKNGLKVYMSVNKEQPRLQTMIAVRVGSKNDPAETTGLAHYFEHLMFKVPDCHFLFTNFLCNSWICNSSGIDICWIFNDFFCCRN